MERAAVAWVLNLDADLELARPRGYTPARRVLDAMRPFAARLASPESGLVAVGDVIVDESSTPGCAAGLVGRAFSPTPRALALLRRAGALPEPHPSVAILGRVNSRKFAAALGPTLPGAAFVTDLDAARAILAGTSGIGDAWRVKRAFGMTGRGQRVVPRGGGTPEDLAFVSAGVEDGGVQIEPNVRIEAEYAIHGMLAEGGSLRIGGLVRQRCDARGAWLATERVSEDPDAIASRLEEQADRVARALHDAGYFGPFGVDAYTYCDLAGTLQLHPLGEINARYTMGFGLGLTGL